MPVRNPDVTDKQQDVLDYIIQHVEDCGYQPSKLDMANHFGCTERAIFDRLKQLESKGVLMLNAREGKKDRAITLHHMKFRAVAMSS